MSNVAAGKDTDDEGEALNDVEKVLNKLDIKLRDSVGEWRNFEDVLDEVADKWKNFAEVERSQIATAIAGTRQQETFRALMNNYDEVIKLTDVAANSSGAAAKKMEIYLDSVEAKTNELKATWEEFVMSLNQSESYKDFLDLCIWLLNNLPTIIGLLTAFLMIFKGGAIFSGTGGLLKSLIGDFKTFILLVKEAKVAGTGFSGTMSAIGKTLVGLKGSAAIAAGAIGIVIAALTIGITAYQKYKQAQLDSVSETKKQVDEIENERNSLDNVRKEYNDIINSSMTLSEKKSKLQQVQNTLNESYVDEKKQIDLVNGSYREQLQILSDIERSKVFEEADKYNQGKDNREKTLKTTTSTSIEGFDANSKVGKKLLETAQKNGMFGTQEYKWRGVFTGFRNDLNLTGNAEQLVKTYKELQEESKNWSQSEQEELGKYLASSNWLQKSMQDDYDKFKEAFDENEKAKFVNFQKNNWSAVNDYKSRLLTMQTLQDEYNRTTDENEKKRLETDINNLDATIKIAKEKLYSLTNDETLKKQLDTLFNSISTYTNPTINYESLNVDGVDNKFIEDLTNEIKDTGKVSEETQAKIIALEQAMSGEDVDSSWLSIFNSKLKELGVNVDKLNLSEDSLTNAYTKAQLAGMYSGDVEGGGNSKYDQSLGHARIMIKNREESIANNEAEKAKRAETGREWSKYNQESLDKQYAELAKYENVAMSYFNNFYESLDEQLTKFGINGNDAVIMALKKNLATGKIEIGDFYSKLSEYLKKLGVDIENLTDKTQDKINGVKFNFKESVGTDEEFAKIPDKIKDLYSAKKTLANGDSLEYDDFRELVDNFEEFADIIDETDDITKLTADDIQDVIDDIIDKTEDDLDTMQKLFEDTMDNIDDIVNKSKVPDSFKDIMQTSMENADEALKNGEKLTFLNPDIVGDEGALTDYATKIDNVATSLDNMSISAESAQTQLYMMALEALEGQTQADALGLVIDLLGTDFNTMDANVQQALIDLGLYNAETGMADSTQMEATLSNIANNFNNADEKTKNAYTSLIQYIAAIGAAENAAPQSGELSKLIAGALGEIKSAAKVGSREIKVRRAGLNSANKAGKDKAAKSGSKNNYSAEDAASDLKDILNDIEDYEADIELELEDQTEELINHYNLERNKLDTLKEELDYYDSIYDVTENTTKWLDTQLKILDEESKKVAEIQNANDKIDKQRQKIYNENSSLNVQSWFDSEGNETLAYGDLLNSFEYRKNQIEKETAAAMRAEYDKVVNSTDKDTIKDAKDRIKQIKEEGDIKIKQIDKERDYVENVYDSVSQLNDAWKDNQEAIRESLQELNDRVKSIRDELIDDIMEQLERAVDKMNTSIEKDVTRLEQLKQVQESYNDILNDTIDTQQELEDELKANMDSYQYLDDTMRQLMFNEDDYKQLSGVIEGIQSDIANIWENHYNQIQNLTEDEMYKAEYITNETERQLAAKQKEYDLAKAELDVAKAQTNLNNVKNERNTRIFANGEWQWVANAENVRNAQQQLMEAEREKTRLEREAEQQLLIDAMDKMIDSDNLQIDKNNELLEKIQDAIEKEAEEVKSIEEALMNADKANLPALTTTLIGALGSDGGYMKELLGEINHSQVELAAALRGQTVQQAIDQLKSGTMNQSDFEELTKRLGFSFNPTTGMVTTQDGSFAAHYKGWVQKSNSDTQLGTAANGVQVTGGQAGSGQANAATSGGNGGGSSFPRNGKVTTSSLPLRIRSGAGTQYKVLGTMPKGANVTILGEANSSWAQVKYGSITGYASRQYLSYDQGGIASGIGYMPKATLEPERVLSPRQTKAFEKLVNNITTNPVLNALSRVPSVNSKLGNLAGETNNSKNYYFSNFTVQADDIKQFINSIETIMPMKNK